MLDEKFKARMKNILCEEYESFISALEKDEAVRGVRVNTSKISVSDFLEVTNLSLRKLSYAEDGFIPECGTGIGNSPEHHSGMIYIQDPGAMSTLNALDIKEGWRVLDMCSAPGGKAGQASSKIGEGGFLHANEYVPKRAKIVVSNFERLGIRNALVTSLDTSELARLYLNYFDLVIADVPCSGEGMFRKSSEALSEWSEENVRLCAQRQQEILQNAKGLVREKGYLLYSTCTYSLEENEMVIDAFLESNPGFKLVPVKEELRKITSDGIVFDGARNESLKLARRFYPHKSEGEGQFIALMQRCDEVSVGKILFEDTSHAPTAAELSAVRSFFEKNLTEEPYGKIIKVGENLIISSHASPIPPRSVFSAGVLLGEVQKGILFPSHQFFMAYGNLFVRKENLKSGDTRIEKYLRGEEIDASFDTGGWCSVLYEGVTLGGGKASLGKIKNHYPKGLRIK